MKTLILIANSEKALFIYLEKGHFKIVDEREHPQSKERASDLLSDQSGRNSGSGTSPHFTLNEGSDILNIEREKFAREVVKCCEERHRQNPFGQLWIVAGPRFLGQLRPLFHSIASPPYSLKEVHKEVSLRKPLDEIMGQIHEWVHENAPRKGVLWKSAS